MPKAIPCIPHVQRMETHKLEYLKAINMAINYPFQSEDGREPSNDHSALAKQCKKLTGIENLTLLSKGRVQKKIHRLQIDFSGSAKGEIVDQLCELLIRWNFDNFLVEIGGKVRAQGKGRRGEGWLVSLKGGDSPLQSKVAVTLRNYAVASCYNFKQQSPVANPNTPHLMDPRTGRPITNELMAVYSFAPTARDADAWATALMILGPVEGMKKADQMDMVVRFCLKKGNSSEFISSQAFQRLFLQDGRNP